eukprot:TRINITY_DN5892_c0_g4_i1.p1 TRINITY_DN5892_c0_g4~~TRINITY_DN5892_c0_g4_i1.p1  ORF type:complete len:188 (+),score=69.53 TRINITY_DN5892_c0_g4_i1:82-645(+)
MNADIIDLATKGSQATEAALLKLCEKLEVLTKRVDILEEEKVAMQFVIKEQACKIEELERATAISTGVVTDVEALQERQGKTDEVLRTTKWTDVDLESLDEFVPTRLYRIAVDEMNDTLKEGWVYPVRVVPYCLIFEAATASSSQYFSRIAATKKHRWEYVSKNAESPDVAPMPVRGTIHTIQCAQI